MGGKWSPEKQREYNQRYQRANRERLNQGARERYERDKERRIEAQKRWYYGNPRGRGYRRAQVASELWLAQDGRCYLCEEEFPLEEMIIEHDHRCCPKGEFCRACIRGAACTRCNKAIGHALDDPDRLERMARNLRAKIAEVDGRLAGKPVQLSLVEEG